MNTLTEIKNAYAIEQGYVCWDDLIEDNWKTILMESHMNEICIRAQKAYGEKAAESAECYEYERGAIDSSSITNPENLIR